VRKNLYLLVIAIFNQLNILKIKLTKIILGKKQKKNRKKPMWKKTVAINSNFQRKLQCFPHIL
jgi:hypothetical protein